VALSTLVQKKQTRVNHLLSMSRKFGGVQAVIDAVKTGVWNMGSSLKSAAFLIESRLIDAAKGNPDAYYELGVAFSTGTGGVDVDLIQAHKWFNLAALGGNKEGQICRADISDEMSREEIAEAQKQARAWLNAMAGAPASTEQRFAA
jgi:uncharacterized protein